jgi:hypothetical protein
MKAQHMTTQRDDLTFTNGESHLVVRRTKDEYLVDMVRWPGRPKERPTNEEEMNAAIDAYLVWPDRANRKKESDEG